MIKKYLVVRLLDNEGRIHIFTSALQKLQLWTIANFIIEVVHPFMGADIFKTIKRAKKSQEDLLFGYTFIMFNKYKIFIEKYISPNIVEWTLFKSKLRLKKFKKDETILYMGDICDELHFIESGLARAYMISEEGKDYTWSIFFNDENAQMTNLFVVDYDSFLNQTPSTLHIEALEDTTVISVDYKDIQFVYDKLKKGERFGRLMSEEAYSYLHKKAIESQIKTAEERFEDFMEKTPYLLKKVPQYHIATFLGMTPQYLSMLKKERKLNQLNDKPL